MRSEQRVQRIVEMMAAGATIAFAAFFALGDVPSREQWVAAAFFAMLGVLATASAYPTSRATSGNISFLPFMSVAIVAPNVAALVCVVISMIIGESLQRRQKIKLVFNAAQQTFTVALAIAAFKVAGGISILETAPQWQSFIAMVGTYFVVNKLAVSTVVAASTNGRTFEHWARSMRGSALYDALALPIVVLLSWIYSEQGPVWTALAAFPLLGIRQLYRAVFALEKVNEELLQLMVASIEARDPYTSGHSQRVALYAREIARVAGHSGRALERVEVAALLHDVGKIHEEFAPILRKPGRLTADEFEKMKLHPVRSAELVSKVSHFADVVPAVRSHHEAWDGSGYPDQLSADAIPLYARVIAIADTLDAMTTSRPYREGMSLERVRLEVQRERGRQFDPTLCDALLRPAAWSALERVVAESQTKFPESTLTSDGVGNTGEFVVLAQRL